MTETHGTSDTNEQQSNKALSAAILCMVRRDTCECDRLGWGLAEHIKTLTRCTQGCSEKELKLVDSLFLPKEVAGEN